MDALFERYYRPLVVFAESYLHDLQSAEDLVQEQMVKLWSKQTFAGIVPEALGTFLFTVVKMPVSTAREEEIACKSLDLLHYQIALEEAERLDDSAVELIRGALEKLPDKTRLVVTVVMLQEKMYKEAAEELGVSVNTVKTLLKQGMRELRELLKDKQELIFYFYLLRAECREQNPIYDHL